jgi:hypothetical protein
MDDALSFTAESKTTPPAPVTVSPAPVTAASVSETTPTVADNTNSILTGPEMDQPRQPPHSPATPKGV